MASLSTPSPKKGLSQSPIVRHKSASPWRLTRFSPYLPRNPLIPGFPTLALAAPVANPLYQAPSSAEQNISQQLPEKVVRLTLPFSLRNSGIPRLPTEDELPELQRLFPTLKSVGLQQPFLVITVEKLPEQPWPTVIADLPLWLAASPYDHPPPDFGNFARASQKFNVRGVIKYDQTPKETTILEIFELVNERGAGVDRICWNGYTFHAFGNQEPAEGWRNRLPRLINDYAISYTWTTSTMEEHASRLKVPAANFTDDTQYEREQLRPGIMLAGFYNNMKQGLGTTSGVCVQSPTSGKRFITVAAHGFPASIGDSVYHPRVELIDGLPDARYQIATIDRKFGDTDIALAQLKPGIRYSGETFSDLGPNQPLAQPFRSFKDPETLIPGRTEVFMNTPVNGQCEGVHLATQWTLGFEASDEAPQERKTFCDVSLFSYWGNGSNIFFEGCCGGVIWDENFDVLGQFRFQEKEGLKRAYSPSFKVLMDQGYRLSSI